MKKSFSGLLVYVLLLFTFSCGNNVVRKNLEIDLESYIASVNKNIKIMNEFHVIDSYLEIDKKSISEGVKSFCSIHKEKVSKLNKMEVGSELYLEEYNKILEDAKEYMKSVYVNSIEFVFSHSYNMFNNDEVEIGLNWLACHLLIKEGITLDSLLVSIEKRKLEKIYNKGGLNIKKIIRIHKTIPLLLGGSPETTFNYSLRDFYN